MPLPSLLLAFSAGAFTFFTPCAFLLPAYLSYIAGTEEGTPRRRDLKRGLTLGLTLSLGVLLVFALIGVLTGVMGSLIKPILPALPLGVGLILILLGAMMFWSFPLPLGLHLDLSSRYSTPTLPFGVLYGLAAVGCSAPIFLSIAVYALSLGSVFESSLLFLFYSLGIGTPLVGVTLLWESAYFGILRGIPRSVGFLRKAASLVLVASGFYLLWVYLRALPPA
jgi:cytochrome c-type biogenesis protein